MISRHAVLRATLKTGKVYCLDFTGAQFGWTETIMEWDTFEKTRVWLLRDEQPLGTMKAEYAQIARSEYPSWCQRQLQVEVAKILANTINKWVGNQGEPFGVFHRSLLNLPIDHFGEKLRVMLSFIKEDFTKELNALAAKKKYMLKFSGQGEPVMTRNF